jgi:hypothetical protein
VRFLAGFLAAYLFLAPVVQADEYAEGPHCIAFIQSFSTRTVAIDGLVPGAYYGMWWDTYEPAGRKVYNASFGLIPANEDGQLVYYVDRYDNLTWQRAGYHYEVYLFQAISADYAENKDFYYGRVAPPGPVFECEYDW